MKGSTRSKVGGRRHGAAYRTPSRKLGENRFGKKDGRFKAKPKASFDTQKKPVNPQKPFVSKPETSEEVTEHSLYPMRLNRYLALHGYSSRREADELIERGMVKVNGRKAKMGERVREEDAVEVDGKMKSSWKQYRYFLYYKPTRIVTHASEPGQKSIKDVSGLPADVFPVGRLDRSSHGLILMTNDGRVTDKLLNPDYNHTKEYVVRVNKTINNFFVRWMSNGIQLEDFKTKPCFVKKLDDQVFSIVLTEGKKHQIRRMVTALGYEVRDLRRIRIMGLSVGMLKPGQYRELRGSQLKEFLASLGLS